MKRRLCAAALSCMMLCSLAACGGGDKTPELEYAVDGVTNVSGGNELAEAVKEMRRQNAQQGMVLEYKGLAVSEDGINFGCYIANAKENEYDMYIQMFSDAGLTDQIYLSGLIKPGTAFESITLDRALDPGVTTAYLAFTQLEEDLETIHDQIVVTMEMQVSE